MLRERTESKKLPSECELTNNFKGGREDERGRAKEGGITLSGMKFIWGLQDQKDGGSHHGKMGRFLSAEKEKEKKNAGERID